VLTINERKIFALLSLHLVLTLNLGKSSPCFSYFPTFSADHKRREKLRLAFPILLHLVLNLNVGKIFALPSVYVVVRSLMKLYNPHALDLTIVNTWVRSSS